MKSLNLLNQFNFADESEEGDEEEGESAPRSRRRRGNDTIDEDLLMDEV